VTSQQDLVDGLIAARARHAHRGAGTRIAQVAAGLVLLVVAAVLSVLVLELGVPLLLLALRLLADELDWAARAYASVAVRWERFRGWLARQSGAVRSLVVLATSIVAIALIVALA
jgi:hypothetical protein